ncbi:MAG: MarR family transcriptional regulator [Candidatus Cloacimonetes bacterium]|nr:MarR family transcriptional regulator [Candidatus Cloacimonadota bacterium]
MKRELLERSIELNKKINQLCTNKDLVQKKCSHIGRMECTLLQLLAEKKQGVCMNELAAVLSVSHSRVTRIVDTLVEKKLVNRFPSEIDRRKWFAKITESGIKMAEQSYKYTLKIQENILARLPEAEKVLDAVEAYLNEFADVLDSFEEDAN